MDSNLGRRSRSSMPACAALPAVVGAADGAPAADHPIPAHLLP